MIKFRVGKTLKDVAKFYLELDPLDPKRTNEMLQAILYVWPVRLSLAFIDAQGTEQGYAQGRTNTKILVKERCNIADHEYPTSRGLYQCEYRIVEVEQLQAYYDHLLDPQSVSSLCHLE